MVEHIQLQESFSAVPARPTHTAGRARGVAAILELCCCVQVPDPPLLRQETEASHAFLSMLLHLASSSSGGAGGAGGSGKGSSLVWAGAAEAQQATNVGVLSWFNAAQLGLLSVPVSLPPVLIDPGTKHSQPNILLQPH